MKDVCMYVCMYTTNFESLENHNPHGIPKRGEKYPDRFLDAGSTLLLMMKKNNARVML
jgi:hypothetical protein